MRVWVGGLGLGCGFLYLGFEREKREEKKSFFTRSDGDGVGYLLVFGGEDGKGY